MQIFHQANIVPASCCNLPVLSSQGLVCSDVVANVTSDDLVANRIYNKVCTYVCYTCSYIIFNDAYGSGIMYS